MPTAAATAPEQKRPFSPTRTGAPSLPVDHEAIALLETAIAQLRAGQAAGFMGALHLSDGSFQLAATASVAAIDDMTAINALGHLMRHLD